MPRPLAPGTLAVAHALAKPPKAMERWPSSADCVAEQQRPSIRAIKSEPPALFSLFLDNVRATANAITTHRWSSDRVQRVFRNIRKTNRWAAHHGSWRRSRLLKTDQFKMRR